MQYFTTSDGLRLAYRDEGTGTPLLALSGLTRNSSDFNFIAPHLCDLRLIRLDYRGRGQSQYAKDFNTYAVPVEARDTLELMDHLGLAKAAILGTSRGGLIGMVLATLAGNRLTGVCLNDIGPEIASEGMTAIKAYLGRRPTQKTYAEAADARPLAMTGFANVPAARWLDEVQNLYTEDSDGLSLKYDPKLRDAVLAASAQPAPDLWPFFDSMDGLPLALIRGENSNILSPDTAHEMRRRRPDMLFADVPDRGHVPFLDEPQSLTILRKFIERLT